MEVGLVADEAVYMVVKQVTDVTIKQIMNTAVEEEAIETAVALVKRMAVDKVVDMMVRMKVKRILVDWVGDMVLGMMI